MLMIIFRVIILFVIWNAFQIVPNPEDKQFIGEGAELKYDDPDVERVRR